MENVLWEDQTFRIIEKKDRIRGTVSYLLQTASDVNFGQKRYWLNIEMGNDVQSLKENVEKWT